jgi:hypothetical protein
LAAHLRPGKIAAGNRHDPPPTPADIAEVERRINGDMGREDEFECWNRCESVMVRKRLPMANQVSDNRWRSLAVKTNARRGPL